jgi:hypothetical protein
MLSLGLQTNNGDGESVRAKRERFDSPTHRKQTSPEASDDRCGTTEHMPVKHVESGDERQSTNPVAITASKSSLSVNG